MNNISVDTGYSFWNLNYVSRDQTWFIFSTSSLLPFSFLSPCYVFLWFLSCLAEQRCTAFVGTMNHSGRDCSRWVAETRHFRLRAWLHSILPTSRVLCTPRCSFGRHGAESAEGSSVSSTNTGRLQPSSDSFEWWRRVVRTRRRGKQEVKKRTD